MAVRCPVPSQESAYRYVNSILDRSEGFLSSGDSPAVMLGGHSKGGNMAVYAAMRIAHDDIEVAGERARRLGLLPSLGGPVRGRNRRISRIFSHDGPGLPKSTVRGQSYRAIESRIRKTVPESSVVGMLLQSNAPVRIVKADAIGIMQHMGNSWQVAENGDFEQVDELTAGAQLIKRTLDGWLDTVSQSSASAPSTRSTGSSRRRDTAISPIWWSIGRIRCRRLWRRRAIPIGRRADSSGR